MSKEPDWIAVLREELQRTSLKVLGRKLGLSPTTVHQVLKGAYKGNLKRIEDRVRGELLNKRIKCPVLDMITPRKCQDSQKSPLLVTNPQRVQLWRACRSGCKHSELKDRVTPPMRLTK